MGAGVAWGAGCGVRCVVVGVACWCGVCGAQSEFRPRLTSSACAPAHSASFRTFRGPVRGLGASPRLLLCKAPHVRHGWAAQTGTCTRARVVAPWPSVCTWCVLLLSMRGCCFACVVVRVCLRFGGGKGVCWASGWLSGGTSGLQSPWRRPQPTCTSDGALHLERDRL